MVVELLMALGAFARARGEDEIADYIDEAAAYADAHSRFAGRMETTTAEIRQMVISGQTDLTPDQVQERQRRRAELSAMIQGTSRGM